MSVRLCHSGFRPSFDFKLACKFKFSSFKFTILQIKGQGVLVFWVIL